MIDLIAVFKYKNMDNLLMSMNNSVDVSENTY